MEGEQRAKEAQRMTDRTPADTVNAVAYSIRERAMAHGWKGAKANAYAMETAAGALAATLALMGEDSPHTQAMSLFAFLTASRGMTHINERAARYIESTAAAVTAETPTADASGGEGIG